MDANTRRAPREEQPDDISPAPSRNGAKAEKKTSTNTARPSTPEPGQGSPRPSAETNNVGVDSIRSTSNNNGQPKPTLMRSFFQTCWMILTHSWVNVLLVFVPAGIIVEILPGMHGAVIFALNCVAVIPLAGMLAFATESVASDMGDALGALMNVTFGNAVELIIL